MSHDAAGSVSVARGGIAGMQAALDPSACSNCGVCVSVCPHSAPAFIEANARMYAGKATSNPVLCNGCVLRVASCRTGAIHLKSFDNDRIFAQLFAFNATG